MYKKSLLNNKLTLYLASRDLIVSNGKIDKVYGVLLVDPEFLQDKKVSTKIAIIVILEKFQFIHKVTGTIVPCNK